MRQVQVRTVPALRVHAIAVKYTSPFLSIYAMRSSVLADVCSFMGRRCRRHRSVLQHSALHPFE